MKTTLITVLAGLAIWAGVARSQEPAAKPDMHAMMAGQQKMMMSMQASDKKLDQAILHTDNETPYVKIVGVIDAIYQSRRPLNSGSKQELVPAFNVTFSVN